MFGICSNTFSEKSVLWGISEMALDPVAEVDSIDKSQWKPQDRRDIELK